MNDYEYTFREDVRQKKSIAASARHKKNGSKSHYVSLPHDHLSRKQWEQKNGEVITIQMNRPMDWEEFKDLRYDLQEDYLAFLVDSYGVSVPKLAEMMGVSHNTLSSHIRRKGFTKVKLKRGARSKQQEMAWKNFLSQSEQADNTSDVDMGTEVCIEEASDILFKHGAVCWQEFVAMPVHEQKEYLKRIREEYGVSMTMTAQMMGIGREKLYSYCTEKGFDHIFRGKTDPTENQLDAFQYFIDTKHDLNEPAVTAEQTEIAEEADTAEPEAAPQDDLSEPLAIAPSSFSLEFKGKLSIGEIAVAISRVLGGNKLDGTVRISFEGGAG